MDVGDSDDAGMPGLDNSKYLNSQNAPPDQT